MSPRWLFLVVVLLLPAVAVPQTSDSTLLSIERIFASRDFMGDRFGPARWLGNGSAYTTLETSETVQGARDIVRYDTKTGARSILVSASLFTPPGDTTALTLEDYEWSPNDELLLIYTNSARVWRQNTRGEYWVLHLKNGELKRLGEQTKPSSMMFCKFSPDNRKVAYVSENNIFVEDLSSGEVRQLTTDGSRTVINGTFDWVYEEELDLRDGFRWSPDSRRIAYWQLDAEGVRDFLMINNTDSLYSYTIPVQYPKAGTTNSAGRVGFVPADGGTTTWLKLDGDPRENYIARMEWAESSEEVIIQYLNRLQNTNRVMLGNVRSGTAKPVLTDTDDAWLDVVDDLKWFDGGKRFTWVSEREGWRHVYLYSRDGKKIRDVTPGAYDVIQVVHIDDSGEWLYFMASPEDAGQRYLYRTRLDGRGRAERLSPKDQPGIHSYRMSPDGRWAFHTYSSFERVPVVSLVSLPDHKVVRTLTANEKLNGTVAALKKGNSEFFRVKTAEGLELDGWMMKPHDFDPTRKYPVLFLVYGEPAAQTVMDRWGARNYLWHLMLTQQGYVVMSVDNRGTPAPRGRAWRKAVYRNVTTVASADQAAAVRVIRTWPFVDSTRIGIWGWSGGGTMTLHALFRYPELYHAGISVAPVTDERYYDTIYEERYMGLPQDNVDGYRDASAVTHVEGLRGNLLVVHGTGDDNVHYQNTEALVNRLIEANKQFSMMAYPNRSHGIFEGRNTSRHLFELLTRYLTTHLPAGPR